jgi:hypothetical protein
VWRGFYNRFYKVTNGGEEERISSIDWCIIDEAVIVVASSTDVDSELDKLLIDVVVESTSVVFSIVVKLDEDVSSSVDGDVSTDVIELVVVAGVVDNGDVVAVVGIVVDVVSTLDVDVEVDVDGIVVAVVVVVVVVVAVVVVVVYARSMKRQLDNDKRLRVSVVDGGTVVVDVVVAAVVIVRKRQPGFLDSRSEQISNPARVQVSQVSLVYSSIVEKS